MAKLQLREALAIHQAMGDRIHIALALEAFAGVSLESARATVAARLWGRAQRLREEIGAPQGISDRARYERQVAAARHGLHDDAAFDLAWGEGRSFTLDDAVRYAMDA
jgi:non-specific serine/threonine protein kinase